MTTRNRVCDKCAEDTYCSYCGTPFVGGDLIYYTEVRGTLCKDCSG